MQSASLCITAALVLAGCGRQVLPEVSELEIERIEREVLVELPPELTVPLAVPDYPPGRLSNEACTDEIAALEEVIRQCQLDRAHIRALEQKAIESRGKNNE